MEHARQIFEKSRTSNFVNVQRVSSFFMRTDRQRDTTKLIVAFRHFVKVPNKSNMFCAARYVELCYITLNANMCHCVPVCAPFPSQNIQSRAFLCEQFSCPLGIVNLFSLLNNSIKSPSWLRKLTVVLRKFYFVKAKQ